MRPLTDVTPKPLIEAGGRALVEHHIVALKKAGVRELVVNLGWLGEKIRTHLGEGTRFGVQVRYTEEGWPALETGGGILRALPLLGAAPFIVVNGDIHADYDFCSLRPPQGLAHLVMVPNPPHNAAGDFALKDGRISGEDGARLTFSGISVLHPRLFDGQSGGAFPLAPLLRAAAQRGQVGGERFDGSWSDVGTPERLEKLRACLNP